MTPIANALRILVQHGIGHNRAISALEGKEIKGQDISGHPYFDIQAIHKFIKKNT
jgi:hypothetical protein